MESATPTPTTFQGHFLQMFQYDLWANLETFQSVIDAEPQDSQISRWMSHIYNAEQLWYDRLVPQSPQVTVWQSHLDQDIPNKILKVNDQITQWISAQSEGSLFVPISYHNSKGTSYQTTPKDILTHIINHSTHHRAQICARLRSFGITPPATDYIFWVRGR
ncbi:DinB family protein [Pontibacter sp. G13]|uniref:DinB family protein n=1 Tax=Pontibacter sp. G13 TaxID=3074898 RepID=UPI00288B7CA8|nr:DinB family protein [Pontibacter sp. G13]WNJ16298.1 DinB family protein [Pontibacter sp. G13]